MLSKMLMNNKKFHESYSELETSAENEVNQEKSFESFGFEVKKFPENFMKINFPPFINHVVKKIKKFENCDTTIVIDRDLFHCHYIVLKCYSEYFASMEYVDRIELPSDQVSAKAFCEIYSWIISDDDKINRSTFAEVFKAAKYLKIQQLINQLMEIVDNVSLIDDRTALSIFLEARAINENHLQSFMVRKISKVFLTFVASTEFLECTYQEIVDFFNSNNIAINSELDMIFIAFRWLLCQWPERKDHSYDLIKLIKFQLISPWQLVEFRKCPVHYEKIFPIEILNAIDDVILQQQIKCAQLKDQGDGLNINEMIPRKYINDPMWKQFDFEINSNLIDGYVKFKQYLKTINACHWTRVKYKDEM